MSKALELGNTTGTSTSSGNTICIPLSISIRTEGFTVALCVFSSYAVTVATSDVWTPLKAFAK